MCSPGSEVLPDSKPVPETSSLRVSTFFSIMLKTEKGLRRKVEKDLFVPDESVRVQGHDSCPHSFPSSVLTSWVTGDL